MYRITIMQDNHFVMDKWTETYVIALDSPEHREPLTQKMGNMPIAAFLTLCLFAETVNLLAQGGTEPPEGGAAAPEPVKPAPPEP
jgi:hypothetical protein